MSSPENLILVHLSFLVSLFLQFLLVRPGELVHPPGVIEGEHTVTDGPKHVVVGVLLLGTAISIHADLRELRDVDLSKDVGTNHCVLNLSVARKLLNFSLGSSW